MTFMRRKIWRLSYKMISLSMTPWFIPMPYRNQRAGTTSHPYYPGLIRQWIYEQKTVIPVTFRGKISNTLGAIAKIYRDSPAGTLISRGSRNRHHKEWFNTGASTVEVLLAETRVNNIDDAIDSERCLRDISSQHHLSRARRRWCKYSGLLIRGHDRRGLS